MCAKSVIRGELGSITHLGLQGSSRKGRRPTPAVAVRCATVSDAAVVTAPEAVSEGSDIVAEENGNTSLVDCGRQTRYGNVVKQPSQVKLYKRFTLCSVFENSA